MRPKRQSITPRFNLRTQKESAGPVGSALLVSDRAVQRKEVFSGFQQRTILAESMPLVALRVSTTSCDCSTMAL